MVWWRPGLASPHSTRAIPGSSTTWRPRSRICRNTRDRQSRSQGRHRNGESRPPTPATRGRSKGPLWRPTRRRLIRTATSHLVKRLSRRRVLAIVLAVAALALAAAAIWYFQPQQTLPDADVALQSSPTVTVTQDASGVTFR